MKPEIQLLLLLAILIFASKAVGHLGRRFLGQPIVLGEILAGLLFGPTLLNMYGWPVFAVSPPFPGSYLRESVSTLASIGVLLLMFLAGLETDLGRLRRAGVPATFTAICGVIFPFGLGLLTGWAFHQPFGEALFLGVVLTATSVSITAQTLLEIRQFHSDEGATILGAAVIDDVLGIILLSFVLAFLLPGAQGHGGSLLDYIGASGSAGIFVTVTLVAVFFLLAVIIGKTLFPAILRMATHMHVSHAVPTAALLLVLVYAVGAEFIGQVAAITGAYLAGIFLARTPFHRQITRSLSPFTYAFFVPIFFMSIGLNADVRSLDGGSWLFVSTIVVVAIFSKVLGCGLGARLTGRTSMQAVRIGIGMVSRGEVGLIIAKIGQDAGLLPPSLFTITVLMVLITTLLTPIMLRYAFPAVTEGGVEGNASEFGVDDTECEPSQ